MKNVILLLVFTFLLTFGFAQTQNALDFDGTDDVVNIGDKDFSTMAEFTVEAWFKTTNTSDNQRIVCKDQQGTPGNFIFWYNTSLGWEFMAYDNVANTWQRATYNSTSENDGNWHHIAGVIDQTDNKVYLYMDGVLKASDDFTANFMDDSDGEELVIGADSDLDNGVSFPFDGTIDEVRMWDVARTQMQLRDNMHKELDSPLTESNLYAYYQFNETSGTNLPDESSNSNDGTLTDMDPSTDWVSSTAPIPYYSVADGNWNTNASWAVGQNAPMNSWANVEINDDVVITSAEDCEDLMINSGASLTVNENQSLTVNGTLTNSVGNGGLVVKSSNTGTGSLIEGSGSDATVERYYTGNQWHLISAPISNATAGMFTGLYLMSHYEPTNAYTDVVLTTTPLNVMQGYSLWNQNGDATASFEGPLNTGIIDMSLTRSSAGDGYGWNLVGNPYPSTIDWDASSGWTKTNVGGSIYLYTGSTWAVYNTTSGGLNGGTQFISSGQGFFVSVNDDGSTTGTLGMTNDIRTHDATTFFKDENSSKLKLAVSNETYTDETIILFLEEATAGFDSQFDAHKLFSPEAAVPQIFSTANGSMAINTLPEVSAVAVDVKGDQGDMLTIDIVGENDFAEVYLEDLETGIITDLKKDDYSFIYDESVTGRFVIHLTPLSVFETSVSSINVIAVDNTVHVLVPEGTLGDILIFNVMGQQISSAKITHNKNVITLGKKAIYLVKVVSTEGIVAKKVYVK